MKNYRILTVDGIKIRIHIKDTGQKVGRYQFSSSKYDIWCFDDSWEVAQEDLAWILKDRVNSFLHDQHPNMLPTTYKRLYRLYKSLIDKGLNLSQNTMNFWDKE